MSNVPATKLIGHSKFQSHLSPGTEAFSGVFRYVSVIKSQGISQGLTKGPSTEMWHGVVTAVAHSEYPEVGPALANVEHLPPLSGIPGCITRTPLVSADGKRLIM